MICVSRCAFAVSALERRGSHLSCAGFCRPDEATPPYFPGRHIRTCCFVFDLIVSMAFLLSAMRPRERRGGERVLRPAQAMHREVQMYKTCLGPPGELASSASSTTAFSTPLYFLHSHSILHPPLVGLQLYNSSLIYKHYLPHPSQPTKPTIQNEVHHLRHCPRSLRSCGRHAPGPQRQPPRSQRRLLCRKHELEAGCLQCKRPKRSLRSRRHQQL
jgi:hypothetical protein